MRYDPIATAYLEAKVRQMYPIPARNNRFVITYDHSINRIPIEVINGNIDHSKLDHINLFESINESIEDLLPDGSHSDLHTWMLHTEMNHDLDHPIETHVDDGGHNKLYQMFVRDQMMQETHPRLARTHISTLDDKDKQTLYHYVNHGLEINPPMRSGSSHVNATLMNRAEYSPYVEYPDGYRFNIIHMDSVLHKTGVPQDKFSTYSGIRFDPSKVKDEKNHINFPCYMSSSTRRATAARYSLAGFPDSIDHHILHIHHHKDQRGIYIGHNPEITKFKDDEFILPRLSLLKLNPTPDTYASTYKGMTRNFHVWHANREA